MCLWKWQRAEVKVADVLSTLPRLSFRPPPTILCLLEPGGAEGDMLCAPLYAQGRGEWALFIGDAGGVLPTEYRSPTFPRP